MFKEKFLLFLGAERPEPCPPEGNRADLLRGIKESEDNHEREDDEYDDAAKKYEDFAKGVEDKYEEAAEELDRTFDERVSKAMTERVGEIDSKMQTQNPEAYEFYLLWEEQVQAISEKTLQEYAVKLLGKTPTQAMETGRDELVTSLVKYLDGLKRGIAEGIIKQEDTTEKARLRDEAEKQKADSAEKKAMDAARAEYDASVEAMEKAKKALRKFDEASALFDQNLSREAFDEALRELNIEAARKGREVTAKEADLAKAIDKYTKLSEEYREALDAFEKAKAVYEKFQKGVETKLEKEYAKLDDTFEERVESAIKERGEDIDKKMREENPEAFEFFQIWNENGDAISERVLQKYAVKLLGKSRTQAIETGRDDLVTELVTYVDGLRKGIAEGMIKEEDAARKKELRTAADRELTSSAEYTTLQQAKAALEAKTDEETKKAEAEVAKRQEELEKEQEALEEIEDELEDLKDEGVDHERVQKKKAELRAKKGEKCEDKPTGPPIDLQDEEEFVPPAAPAEPLPPLPGIRVDEPGEDAEKGKADADRLAAILAAERAETSTRTHIPRPGIGEPVPGDAPGETVIVGRTGEVQRVATGTYEVGDGEHKIEATSKDIHDILVEDGFIGNQADRISIAQANKDGMFVESKIAKWDAQKEQYFYEDTKKRVYLKHGEQYGITAVLPKRED